MGYSPNARCRRGGAIVATLVLVLALVAPLAVARPTAAQSADPVDLAALIPGVDELADVGLDDFVPSFVHDYSDIDSYLESWTFDDPDLRDEWFDDLDDAGFVRDYEVWWSPVQDVLDNYDGESWDPDTQVRFLTVQFADEDGAEDALTVINPGPAERDADVDRGDATVVTTHTFADGDLELAGVDITVQVGAILVGVLVRSQPDSDNEGNELDLATELAEEFVETVEDLDESPTQGPGLDVVRFTAPSLFTSVNSYVMRDEQPVWAYTYEDADARNDLNDRLVDLGTVSIYDVNQSVPTEELEDEAFGYQIRMRTILYASEDIAQDLLANSPDDWEAVDYEVSDIDDPPDLGDGTLAFEAVDEDETQFNSIITWTDGPQLFRIYLTLPTRPADPDALFALAEAQVECRDEGTCWEHRDLPDAVTDDTGPLIGGGSVPDDEETPTPDDEETPAPDDEETPTPDDEETPVADDGDDDGDDDRGTYVGADYDFTVSWDTETWTQVEDYEASLGAEGIRLSREDGGTLFIEVIDDASAEDLPGCVEAISDTVLAEDGVDDITPLEDEDGDEIAGEDDDLSFAGYAITYQESPAFDYFACAALDDGETAVAFIYIGNDPDEASTEIADVEAVIATYEAG